MNKKIGPILGKYFVEECEKNNRKSTLSKHKKPTDDEIALIEEILLRIDKEEYDLISVLNNHFGIEQE